MAPRLKSSVALFQIAVLLTACGGNGPPERRVWLNDFNTPHGRELTLAVRSFSVTQRLNVLGDFSRTLDYGIEISLCNALSRRFEQLLVIHESLDSAVSNSNFERSRVLLWHDSTVKIRRTTSLDTSIVLPPAARRRTPVPDSGRREAVVPACMDAIVKLRDSNRMPDGSLATDTLPFPGASSAARP